MQWDEGDLREGGLDLPSKDAERAHCMEDHLKDIHKNEDLILVDVGQAFEGEVLPEEIFTKILAGFAAKQDTWPENVGTGTDIRHLRSI